jgi:hypothetical protein
MRRFLILSAVILALGCADQATDPCVLHITVLAPVSQFNVGATRTVTTQKGVISGKCTFPTNAHLSWSSSSTSVINIESSNDSTATVHANKVGTSTISAWLVLTPAVRDSAVMTVVQPTGLRVTPDSR